MAGKDQSWEENGSRKRRKVVICHTLVKGGNGVKLQSTDVFHFCDVTSGWGNRKSVGTTSGGMKCYLASLQHLTSGR